MKTCRENLDKLKSLCEELSDRDQQLKINASTLWDILERVHQVKENLSNIHIQSDADQDNIDAALEKLSEISDLVSERGCKRVVRK
jgi:DNA repair ATPase RecN